LTIPGSKFLTSRDDHCSNEQAGENDRLHLRWLQSTTAEQFPQLCDQLLPSKDAAVTGASAFFVRHESYHQGEMALRHKRPDCPAAVYQPRCSMFGKELVC
jgi:hypothetical protein